MMKASKKQAPSVADGLEAQSAAVTKIAAAYVRRGGSESDFGPDPALAAALRVKPMPESVKTMFAAKKARG